MPKCSYLIIKADFFVGFWPECWEFALVALYPAYDTWKNVTLISIDLWLFLHQEPVFMMDIKISSFYPEIIFNKNCFSF